MMAKNQGIDPKAATAARIKRTEAYAEKVRLLFAQTVNDILALNKTMPKLDDGVMFSFDGESLKRQKEVEALLRRLHSSVTMAIQQGVSLEWAQANAEADKLIKSVFGQKVLDSPEFTAWTQRNTAARDAFLARSEKGLNLSDRVWKSVRQLRDEMEVAMTVSIGEGKSASAMSRDVRQYLNDPDLMFRRFRYKKGEDAEGNPIYGRKWKKRVKDEATGKYKWIDYDRDSYPTGQGVYKSSAKNAMRLTRTETNIAYRRADHERWQQMDFVLGQRVQLSKNHPRKDICDKLQGDYPKEFVFDGWHPQCFCLVTPILVDEEEMAKVNEAFLRGEKYIPKGKKITEYPDNFKDWVTSHAEDIKDARDRGTEPYFIRNNAAVIDEILDPKPKELSIAEKAALRHAARTPEQEDAIRRAWAERNHQREVIKKGAGNVLKVAQDWPEVDYADLQAAIDSGDYMRMKAASKAVAQSIVAMRNEEKALSSLIPDVHTWHKSVTLAELQGVYSAVESKLIQWAGLPLAQQAKKLQFEAIDFLGGNMKDVQAKFPKTWKISQAAYLKKLDEVNYRIAVNGLKSKLQTIKAWLANHPKSAKVAMFVQNAELAIANGDDIKTITGKVNLANNEYLKRLAEQMRRNKKKAVSTVFDADDYTQESKNNAIWCQTAKESHQHWDVDSEAAWTAATAEEQEAWRAYTGGSGHMNRPLRGYDGGWGWSNYAGVGNVDLDNEGGAAHIHDLYNLLERTTFTTNRWLQRGIETWSGVEGFFGIQGLTRAQLRGMVGQEVCDHAFVSCGSAKGTGFSGLILNIYCPKGTKGVYACPHSHFGDGENETILQLGTRFRIIRVEAPDTGPCYVDIEVIGYSGHPQL